MNYSFRVNGQGLNEEEYKILSNFLIGINKRPRTKLIYRGESVESLREKLNIGLNENLYDTLNYFIFKIGEKGRVYQKRFAKQLKSKSHFSIRDTSEIFLKYIFTKINHVLTKSKNPEILKFQTSNPEFVKYFTTKSNKIDFVSKITKLPTKEQLEVRDYYLTFLHRVGRLGFYLNSFFLSTTLSKKIAKEFTKKGDIIFVSWRNLKLMGFRNTILSKNLPTYHVDIFKRQKEVPLKGGLFPQDILGFIDRNTNVFHVNPNLFRFPELIDYMIDNGIPINQDDFHEVRAKTDYSGSFTSDGVELNDDI